MGMKKAKSEDLVKSTGSVASVESTSSVKTSEVEQEAVYAVTSTNDAVSVIETVVERIAVSDTAVGVSRPVTGMFSVFCTAL
jgi:hypothetical protein